MRTLKIVKVRPMDNYSVQCEMENGEVYLYDMTYVHEREGEMIKPLKNIDFF